MQSICVPDGCSAVYLTFIFKQFGIKTTFSEENCQTAQSGPELDAGAIAAMSFFGAVLMIMCTSTFYDCYYQYYLKTATPANLLTIFSIITNGKRLFSTSKSPNSISCMHGIRVLSTMWIIIYHRNSAQMTFPMKRLLYIVEWASGVGSLFLANGTISVDTFFLMGGLVLAYSYLISKRKGKKFNIPLFYIHRYLRLVPVLAVIILFHITLLKYIGTGPLWPRTMAAAVGSCEESWWKTLLFIQNYAAGECITQAWYLSVDTQLYLLSPIILLPLTIWPKLSLIGTGILAVLSIASCFLAGWMSGLNGQGIGNRFRPELFEDYYQQYYSATHTRAAVWLIGVLYGYLLFNVNDKNCKWLFHKVVVVILWAISLTVLCTCVFAGHDLIFESEIDKFENSIYLALVRPAWGIAIGWIILACYTGYGGPINWFLSLPLFEVLGKLCYAMYMVHVTIISVHLGQMRTPEVLSEYYEMYIFWGDFAFTLFVSIIVYLAFEYPMALIEGQLFGKSKGNTKKINEKIQDDTSNASKRVVNNHDSINICQ